jgi:PKD repeat protein
VYLTSTSNYADARFYSIIAAGDLFGGCSAEVEATTRAWYAVGVGANYAPVVQPDFKSDYTSLCSAPATIQFTNLTVNANTYAWDFGDGNTSTQANPLHTYYLPGDYDVKLVAYGGICGIDSITKISHISIDSLNSASISSPASGAAPVQMCCSGTLYDNGGTGMYSNNTDGVVTIAPPGALNVVLYFVSFDMESGYDYLYVHDGPNTASPIIGVYDGNSLPNGGTITSTGGAITLRQLTDQGVVAGGFEINWQCNYPNAAPVSSFSVNLTETCTGVVQFTDLSTNIPNQWLWDFGDGQTSNAQHPQHAYSSSGTFTVTLTSGNSFGSNFFSLTNYITVNLPASPAVSPQTICENTSATLNATGNGTLTWFDVPLGGVPLATGTAFQTPVLVADETYYVEDQMIGTMYTGGKATNSGTGAYFQHSNQHGLFFNCTQPCTLVSVKVYADGGGQRTITLLDSTGATLMTGAYNMPDGESRVTLNWAIPVKNGMRLMGQGAPNLYRNGQLGGPNLGFPFHIGGKINIYKSTAGSPNDYAFYYFYYDWEVQDPTCISARIPVDVTVINCTGLQEIPGVTNINISPNPATDMVFVSYHALQDGAMQLSVQDVTGRQVMQETFAQQSGLNRARMDVSGLSAGVYVLKLRHNDAQYSCKIIVN